MKNLLLILTLASLSLSAFAVDGTGEQRTGETADARCALEVNGAEQRPAINPGPSGGSDQQEVQEM